LANYRLAPNATLDLERIWLYGFETWGLDVAESYQNAFFEHFEELAQNPKLYAIVDERKGYRRSICGRDSVYYRIDGDTVEIMAIIGRQDMAAWL